MEGEGRGSAGRYLLDTGQIGTLVGALVGALLLGRIGLSGLVGGWTVGGLAGAEVGYRLPTERRGTRTSIRGRTVKLVGSLLVGTSVLLATHAYQFSDFAVQTGAFALVSLVSLCLLLNYRRSTSVARAVVSSWGGFLLLGLFVSFLLTGVGSPVGAGPGAGTTPTETTTAAEVTTAPGDGSATTTAVVQHQSVEVKRVQTETKSDDPSLLQDRRLLATLGLVAVLVGTLPRLRRR